MEIKRNRFFSVHLRICFCYLILPVEDKHRPCFLLFSESRGRLPQQVDKSKQYSETKIKFKNLVDLGADHIDILNFTNFVHAKI